jgi:RNA polymerase sigma-70 factor (ECF subfamily)
MTTQRRPFSGRLLAAGSARENSREADWQALYERELPRVYNFFRYHTGDDATAEDLTATTFEKAWRARERYLSDLAAFSTWLFSIARNVAADHFRHRRAEVSLDDVRQQAADPQLEDDIERRAEFTQLYALLARFSSRDRELLALKYGAGLTNRAIADLTGLSESNVGTILHRTIASLRAEWSE